MREYGLYSATASADFPGDDRLTVTDTVRNTSRWIVSKPWRKRVYAGTAAASDQLLALEQYGYDGADYNVAPTQGDVTKTGRRYNAGSTALVEMRASYDAFGNVIQTLDELQAATTTAYDTAHRLFPVTVTNPVGHVTQTTWSVGCGQPATTTDPNGLVTTYTYDALCRQVRQLSPTGGAVSTSYTNLGTPAVQAVTTRRTAPAKPSDAASATTGGDIWSMTTFDGFGRTVLTAAEGPDGDTGAGLRNRILTQTRYGQRGAVWKTTAPYYADASGGASTGETVAWTTFTVDKLDRVVKTTYPDTVVTTTAYATVTDAGLYDSVAVTETLAGTTTRTTTVLRDGFGRTKVTRETLDGSTVSTTLDWSRDGDLLRVTDPRGTKWEADYDLIGRRTAVRDQNLGAWSFAYDAAGRLTSQVDAIGQTTCFAYDAIGRMTAKNVTAAGVACNPAAASAVRVVNTYDEARSGYYNVGHLTTTEQPDAVAGGQRRVIQDYDAGGRQARLGWRYTGLGSFDKLTSYWPLGEVKAVTYPKGITVGTDTASWRYDAAGRLTLIPGLVSTIAYRPNGSTEAITYGNGVTTAFAYDPNRAWLTKVTHKRSNNTTLREVAYQRDAAGRVTKATTAGQTDTWTYGYDALDRLVSASNVNASAPAGESRTFTYDTAGNLTNQSTLGTYVYPTAGGTHPHAPNRIEDVSGNPVKSYGYDGNGNVTLIRQYAGGTEVASAKRLIAYDGENRPVTVTRGA